MPVMPVPGIRVQHTVGHGMVERKQSRIDNIIEYLWRVIQDPAPRPLYFASNRLVFVFRLIFHTVGKHITRNILFM